MDNNGWLNLITIASKLGSKKAEEELSRIGVLSVSKNGEKTENLTDEEIEEIFGVKQEEFWSFDK